MDILVEGKHEINSKPVAKLTVREIKFVELAKLSLSAVAGLPADTPKQGPMRTARMTAQTTVVFTDGKSEPLSAIAALALPIKLARKLINIIDNDVDDSIGSVLQDGDGVTTPILYKLGTPIVGAGSKEITELEFLAKTYGDLENVLGEDNPLDQAIALIRYVAKPVGMLSLPSWALDQISVSDGMFVVRKLVPRFLEPEEELPDA